MTVDEAIGFLLRSGSPPERIEEAARWVRELQLRASRLREALFDLGKAVGAEVKNGSFELLTKMTAARHALNADAVDDAQWLVAMEDKAVDETLRGVELGLKERLAPGAPAERDVIGVALAEHDAALKKKWDEELVRPPDAVAPVGGIDVKCPRCTRIGVIHIEAGKRIGQCAQCWLGEGVHVTFVAVAR